jgi:hypothetical protein
MKDEENEAKMCEGCDEYEVEDEGLCSFCLAFKVDDDVYLEESESENDIDLL